MKIYGVDIDNVLADFNTGFIDLIKDKTGIELPRPSDTFPDTWAFHTPYVTSKQTSALWDHMKKSNFWMSLAPLPMAKEALEFLTVERFAGNQVYFITSRPGLYAKYQTEAWLQQYGFRVPTVLISPSDWAKGQLAKALKLDVFIDDKPNNIAEVQMAMNDDGCRAFLVDAPYNRDISGESEMYMKPYERVKNALEALERVQERQSGEQLRRAA